MKIGIDARLWSQTGVGRYIRNLSWEISRTDKTNNYVLFVRSEDYEDVKKSVNSPMFKTVSVNAPWHSIKEQIYFPKIINNEKLDLMHFTYFSVPILYKRPYVLTIHDLTLNHFKSGKASTRNFLSYNLKRKGYATVLDKASKNALSIIAVSKATKHEIVDHLGILEDKVSVVYEGIDESIVSTKKPSIIEDPYILYVGNVYPHKNAEKMILAFMKAKKPELSKLVFVGKEDFFYRDLKKKISKIDPKKRIVFMGFVEDEVLSSLYRNANALIMPSLMEGFGLPVLEAMANKCFVIASNIPSLKEIGEEGIMYFNPSDINDISEKIELAFSNFDKTPFINKSFERSKSFSWNKMAKETIGIYENSVSLRQG